jgi:hypothetical protein
MPTKLSVFNGAMQILAQSLLTDPDVNIEAGRHLREAWVPAVMACYEEGSFNHTITRAALARLDDGPTFGYQYYYQLPTDFVRVVEISSSGMPGDALTAYENENGKIATDADAVYLKYVSNELLTLTPGEWSQSFADFVSSELAVRAAPKINGAKLDDAIKHRERNRKKSLGLDAIQNPPAPRRQGRWTSAARGMGRNTEQGR